MRCILLNNYPDIMSVSQLAEALNIGKNSAYNLLHNNMIGFKKIGRKYLIPKSCVIDFIKSAQYSVVYK